MVASPADLDGRLRQGEYTVDMMLTVHSWVVPSAELVRGHTHTCMGGHTCVWGCAGCVLRAGWAEPPLGVGPPQHKVSLLLDHLEVGKLARHLSGLEHRAFCRLSCQDCRRYVQRGGGGGGVGTPALEQAIALCNGVCRWVQLMVLSRPTAPQRTKVVAKFTCISQELRELQNFNTLMAVVGGLCHSSISHLKATQALLPPEVAKVLGAMAELVLSRGNFGAYRWAFGGCWGFRLPLLAVHLKDLAALDAALPGVLPGGGLNLPKLHGLYQHALDLRALQRLAPPFRTDPPPPAPAGCETGGARWGGLQGVGVLRGGGKQGSKGGVLQGVRVDAKGLSLDTAHTEEELYVLSHTREPPSPKATPPLTDKTPRDGEWGPPGTPKAEPRSCAPPTPPRWSRWSGMGLPLPGERDRLLEKNRRLRPAPLPPALGALRALRLRDPPLPPD
ncbi:LOW QUALITY PROTEIN: RAS guanyl-releasing protein 4 [Harpia harpyja]|uniref:LOW QUALITY PROTEIN: RAS guanyl-releasing protein 4 n=1 Tax=Harpia harpyja TaxID=202280 RepID=UPI0022B1B0C2|nr:LOW QUALITY PROTEIN: RAS guanyl-releasing protein 4 [Harpia harpyja]